MDHIVIPLDDDHERAATSIVAALTAAVDAAIHPAARRPHITLVTYQGISRRTAHDAVRSAVKDARRLVVRAHGYGFFCGDDGHDLSLHVPVVRGPALDALHELVHAALLSAGARLAGWTDSSCWSPHITLVEGGLDPRSLGAGAGWLAQRHHPSWRIPVNRLSIVTGARFGEEPASTIELSGSDSATAEPEARAQAG
jgi:2'-5' RNA ligase